MPLSEWQKIKNSHDTECWQRCGETRSLVLLVGTENGTATLETVWEFPKKLKLQPLCYSATAFLALFPANDLCSHTQKNLYINFYSSFINNSQTGNNPNCPSIGD